MKKIIIFDLAEVYLTGMKDFEYVLEKIIKIPAFSIEKQLKDTALIDLFHGKISEEDYWKRIISENKWNVDIDLLKKLIRKNFKEIKGTKDLIKRLKNKGYKVALLSVHAKEWIEYCEKKFDYHKLFDSVLYSFDASALKDDKVIFELILEKLDVKPEQCIFIDDMQGNLDIAKSFGIDTILFKNSDQLEKELKLLDIL